MERNIILIHALWRNCLSLGFDNNNASIMVYKYNILYLKQILEKAYMDL